MIGSILAGGLAAGCALATPLPDPTTLDTRLAAFPTGDLPLEGPVTLRWNRHQVPFIEAESETDAAFALGLVHAHLRLGQMAILKRIAQGRLAEMGGPLATDIDRGLRMLGYGRAAAEIERGLPDESRAWLEAFVAGINLYQERIEVLPHEYRVLGLEREPWTVRDVLTFGRLAGTDVNWLVWVNLLELRSRPDWPEIWTRLTERGSDSVSGLGASDRAAIASHLAGLSRSGSNSVAVAGTRTESGAALMANDPHLGIYLPDLWIIAGLRTPRTQAVGLMVPGLPFFAIGRNPDIAWGGTNLRAAASDLVDLSDVPDTAIELRKETIEVRWWFDAEVTIRETRWGPVISDAPFLKELGAPPAALRWTGHWPSDEISAMLAVSRARNFAEFRAAFEGFATPGQAMLYADAAGNIGQVVAVRLPRRAGPPSDLLVPPAESDATWERFVDGNDLPARRNPKEGYLASANNRPRFEDAGQEPEVALGFFFSPEDRIERMAGLLGGEKTIEIADLEALQRDVAMPSSTTLRDVILAQLDETGIGAAANGRTAEAVTLLRGWDGSYRTGSRGALAFELFRTGFVRNFYQSLFGESDWAAFAGVARARRLLIEDIREAPPDLRAAALRRGLEAAADGLDEFETWGEVHRLGLSHPLVALPLIGGRYRFADEPIGGSSDTLMKTAHGLVEGRHYARYGSNARHLSDLSNPDANYFVLLGGQDGWINSENFLDQLPLWLEGRYIQVPLQPASVREAFPIEMRLGPGERDAPGS